MAQPDKQLGLRMITVNLQGGIGNTLFQYAYARSLGDAQLFDNCTQYGCHLGRFNTKLPITTKPEGRWISERGLPYDPHPEVENPSVQNGYWQCEKYFSHITDILRQEFTLKEAPSTTAKQYAEQILGSENSIAVHVRRGDYLTWAKERHGVLPTYYYVEALSHFNNACVYLFSDDQCCPLPVQFTPFIRVSCLPHEDLWLMSLCKNAIIANSSFSWWGAWLGADKNGGKVIAPKQWFAKGNEDSRDIVPSRWTQL